MTCTCGGGLIQGVAFGARLLRFRLAVAATGSYSGQRKPRRLTKVIHMAELKDDPITVKDLEEFVRSNSDFAFEMQVLAQLRTLGFECSHSGTYRDPVTDKIRQFDIRAIIHKGNSTLALAAECKNLRPNNPLLLSAVPRTEPEAFHDLIVWNRQKLLVPQSVWAVTGHKSIYRPGELVGKKTDQVGRDTSNALVSNDEGTFEKLNQAVNSCQGLVREYALHSSAGRFRAIVPLLVVPTGLLWQVDYDPDGKMGKAPHQVTRATLFLNHPWSAEGGFGRIVYRLSHVEFATLDAVPSVLETYLAPGGFFGSAG